MEEPEVELELNPKAAEDFVDTVYDWREDLPNEKQRRKFKELYYFADVHQNVDRYRLENLRQMSRQKYDDINVN